MAPEKSRRDFLCRAGAVRSHNGVNRDRSNRRYLSRSLIVHSAQQNAQPVFCAAIEFGNFLLKPGAIVDDIALPGGEGTFQRWFNL
jgi:hypothetical protein